MPKAKQKPEPTQNTVNIGSIVNSIKKINLQSLLIIALIIMSFAIGRLTQRVEDLEGGVTSTNTNTTATTATAAPAAATNVTQDQIKALWNDDIIKIGDANKKLLFVEVGDPSCPYCHAAGGVDGNINKQVNLTLVADGGTYQAPVPEMKKLVDSGQASFAYIYYPGHGNGEMGMKALYCANEKGKFWQAHDLLMSDPGYTLMNTTVKNDKTQSQAVATFLKSAVDATFMKSCLDSGKYDARLTADMGIASSLGVQGTPGFFINATAYPGAYAWTDMQATVTSALK